MSAKFERAEGDVNFSKIRDKWQQENITDAHTKDILDKDARYFLHQSMSTPCIDVLKSCKGASIINLNGKEYLDFHGNNVHQIGYGNSYVIDRIKKQLDTLPFSPRRYTNEVAVNFAEKLTRLLPGDLNRVLLAPGGTSVIGIALKLARIVTGKHKVISYWDSFHGASLDAISVGGEAIFKQDLGPMMPGVVNIPPPMNKGGVFSSEEDNLKYLEYVIEKEGGFGVFLAETIRNTDVQIPSEKYWKSVREICDKNGVLLVLDEIPIALGRTGKMFAFENYGIEPDILCIGKGLGGGVVPMAAMVCREKYNVASHVSLGHYTHEKSPLGCIAALASIEYIENDNILKKVKEKEAWMRIKLNELKSKFSIISEVRGIGLLWAVEIADDENGRQPAGDLAEKIMYNCLENGLSFKVSNSNVLTLSPSLMIDEEKLENAIKILSESLSRVTRKATENS